MFTLNQSFWSIKTTPDRGRGVFAEKDIPPGTVIGDYLGKIIGLDEEDDSQVIYSMDYRTNACIMPDPQDIGVHLINHSCMPNCYMYPHQGHILIVTARLITAGEEINYRYYISPISTTVGPVHACFCQTPFCHGTMYTNHQKTHEHRSLLRKIDPLLLGSAASDDFGKEITLLLNYPQAPISDVPFYDIFGSLQLSPYEITDATSFKQKVVRNLIRETGRCLLLKEEQTIVVGVMDGAMIIIEASEWENLIKSS